MKSILTHEDSSKRMLLNNESMNHVTEAINMTLNNINQIDLNIFNRIANYIIQSNKVIFYAYDNNINFTLKTQVDLLMGGKLSFSNIDILRQLKTIQEADDNDLLICISMGGSSHQGNNFKKIVTEKKLKTVLITQISDVSEFDYFDIILNIGPDYGFNSNKYGIMYILDLINSAYQSKIYFL